MKENITIALFGTGRIGKMHAQILCKEISGARVKYVVSRVMNEDVVKWAKELNIEYATTDVQKALDDPEVDAVYICTHTDSHAEYIIKAAQSGKHIFSEKPLDSDLVRLFKALKVVKENNVRLHTGFMRRFDKNNRKVKRIIQSGEIGTPQMIKVTSRDSLLSTYEYLKKSGGIFFDMMIHDFDMVRFLSDSDVIEVYATGGVYTDECLRDIQDVDTAIAVLKLENGMIAVIDIGRQCWYGQDQRSEVFCTLGTVQAMNETKDTVIISKKDTINTPSPIDFWVERFHEAYVTENQAFIDCLRYDKPVPVAIRDGIEPIRIAKAAQMSCDQNRVVKLTEIEDIEN